MSLEKMPVKKLGEKVYEKQAEQLWARTEEKQDPAEGMAFMDLFQATAH